MEHHHLWHLLHIRTMRDVKRLNCCCFFFSEKKYIFSKSLKFWYLDLGLRSPSFKSFRENASTALISAQITEDTYVSKFFFLLNFIKFLTGDTYHDISTQSELFGPSLLHISGGLSSFQKKNNNKQPNLLSFGRWMEGVHMNWITNVNNSTPLHLDCRLVFLTLKASWIKLRQSCQFSNLWLKVFLICTYYIFQLSSHLYASWCYFLVIYTVFMCFACLFCL